MAWNICDSGAGIDFRRTILAHYVVLGLNALSLPLHLAEEPDFFNSSQRPGTIDIDWLPDLDPNVIDWDSVPIVAVSQFGRRYLARLKPSGGNLRPVLEFCCSVLTDGLHKSVQVLISRVWVASLIKDWPGSVNGRMTSAGLARWGRDYAGSSLDPIKPYSAEKKRLAGWTF